MLSRPKVSCVSRDRERCVRIVNRWPITMAGGFGKGFLLLLETAALSAGLTSVLMILLGVFHLRSISNCPLNFILVANINELLPAANTHFRPRGYSSRRARSLPSRCSSGCSARLLSGVLLVTAAALTPVSQPRPQGSSVSKHLNSAFSVTRACLLSSISSGVASISQPSWGPDLRVIVPHPHVQVSRPAHFSF